MTFLRKDPQDVLWYAFDWSGFLETGETITTYTVACDPELTQENDTSTDTSVLIQVSGGSDGDQSVISCLVNTSSSNTYETESTVYIRTRTS